jgi:hypothetical protein
LNFPVREQYDTRKEAITLSAQLCFGGERVTLETKLDTGSSDCIFARSRGEVLGINIESGRPQRFGTATGSFLAYGHELVLRVHGFEFESTVYFAEAAEFKRDVLGLTGFVDRVQLGLIHYVGELYLNRLTNNGE